MFWGLPKRVQHVRLKAQLVGISFPRIYNPNEAELKFDLANNSGRDYELPSKVKLPSDSLLTGSWMPQSPRLRSAFLRYYSHRLVTP